MPTNYDPFAAQFAQTRKKRSWPEFDVFKPYIKNNERILDLGCGSGRLRHFLSSDQIKPGAYFGFDLSHELLDIARNDHPDDHFFRGDFSEKLPFGAENFDWVISIAAFHHLTNKKSQEFLMSEIHRITRPKGKVFMTTWVLPKKYFWMNFWKGRVFSKNWIIPFGKEKHIRIYRDVRTSALKSLFKKAGFKIIKLEKFKDRNYIILAEKI